MLSKSMLLLRKRILLKMIIIFSVFLMLNSSLTLQATELTGTIKGIVTDANTNKGLLNANVVLLGTRRGAATDQNGIFLLINVPAGTYQVKVSFIGFEPVTKTLDVLADEATLVDFSLREDFFQTQQVVVTATRSEKLMEDVPVVTELVTRAEIDEKGAGNVAEILEDRPGIAIESEATGGKFLYMNGVDSRRILILVDNVPIAGKLNNRIHLDLLDSDNIEHIEILKGPGSALYGNDAMGGVINIITKGFSKGFSVQANGRAGSNDLYSGNLSLSGGKETMGYLLNLDYDRQGLDKGAAEIEIKETTGSGAQGKLFYKHENWGQFELHGEYRQDQQNTESAFMGGLSQNEAKINNKNTSLFWNRTFSENSQLQLTSYYSDNLRIYKSATVGSNRPASPDSTTDMIYGLKSDLVIRPLNHLKLDLGVDFSENEYENERLSETQTRQQTGFFSQVETSFIQNLTFVLGGRYDKISNLKGKFSPRLSAMYIVSPSLKLRGSWGSGFRAPAFVELFSDFLMPIPGMPMRVLGNADLKPEKSNGGNFSVEYLWKSFAMSSATVFQNKFKDMIVEYQIPPLTFSYLNVQSAMFRGLELQTRLNWSQIFSSTVSYNFTDINQKKNDVAFSKISPHTASVKIVYGMFNNRLKFSLREQLFSKRDILVVSKETGGYTKAKKNGYDLLDLTASFKLNEMLTLRAGTTNLRDYTDINYGPYIGRRFFVGLNTSFQRE